MTDIQEERLLNYFMMGYEFDEVVGEFNEAEARALWDEWLSWY